MPRSKRFGFAAVTLVIILVFLGIAVEVIARDSLPKRVSYRTVMESQPPPYQNAPYWGPEFIRERWEVASHLEMSNDGPIPGDYTGQYYNFTNGERVTVGQPTNYQFTIYIFGSSTIYDPEVPDNFTLASQLQALVGTQYRVVNRGVISLVDSQIALRIESTPIKEGDIVIFYEPWNDLIPLLRDSVVEHRSALCNLFNSIRFVRSLPTTSAACQWDGVLRADDLQRLEMMRENIITTVKDARSYVQSSGAQFYYVTPPFLWAKAHPTDYERQLLTVIDSLPVGLIDFGKQIPAIDLGELDPLNLYHLLDDEDNVFVTHNHVNERGDYLIAQAIANILPINVN